MAASEQEIGLVHSKLSYKSMLPIVMLLMFAAHES